MTEAVSRSSVASAAPGRDSRSSHSEPSQSWPARIGTTRRALTPGPAGARNGSSEVASRRNTPAARKCETSSLGTRRPMIVLTRAGSLSSCPEE